MKKVFTLSSLLVAFLVTGCGQSSDTPTNLPAPDKTAAPAGADSGKKVGASMQVGTPGPGAASADSRLGSATKGK